MDQATYPPQSFTLSEIDALDFESLADQLVAETLRSHDDLVSKGRIVDLERWKTVKEKNNMTAYRTRQLPSANFRRNRFSSDITEVVVASPQMPSFCPTLDKKTQSALSETYAKAILSEDDAEIEFDYDYSPADVLRTNVLEKTRPEYSPVVFCIGVVPGTVEDAALGFLADTERQSRMRNVSTKEVIVDDMRILTRIHGPTEEDPFRFLGIKWCVHSTGGATESLIKPRDYVVLESTGIALDSDGVRFCYMLNHSIELDEVPDFRQFGNMRTAFSICHIMRPCSTTGAIEAYCRGYVDAAGYLAGKVGVYLFCDRLMTVPHIVDDAYTKKLIWLFQTKLRSAKSRKHTLPQVSDTCPCCHEKFRTGFTKLLEGRSTCQICKLAICRKCTVQKTIPLDVVDVGGPKQLIKKAMDFCLSCYLEAKNLSAWQVAVDSLPVCQAVDDSLSSTATSTT